MSYAEIDKVKSITGLSDSDIVSDFLTIADQKVENIVNYDMDSGVFNRDQYFDIINLNDFVVYYDGLRDFVLDRKPINSVSQVSVNPYDDNPTILTVNDDYYYDDNLESVRIKKCVSLFIGVRKLKISYIWGYSQVPQDVKDYASWLASFYHESRIPKSDGNNNLKEWEIGRYRELYDVKGEGLSVKYSFLKEIEDDLIIKYRISL